MWWLQRLVITLLLLLHCLLLPGVLLWLVCTMLLLICVLGTRAVRHLLHLHLHLPRWLLLELALLLLLLLLLLPQRLHHLVKSWGWQRC
jgi:hypothetical protein